MKRNSPEHDIQVTVFQLAAIKAWSIPEYRLLYAIPNAGKRSKFQGQWLVNEGMKAGVPDVHLPVARYKWHSLYIEHKSGKNTLTDDQEVWRDLLVEQGNLYLVSRSADYTMKVLDKYLGLPKYGEAPRKP